MESSQMDKKSLLYSYLPINWEDGMLVDDEHLAHFNKFVMGLVHNSTLVNINPTNYGLLPYYDYFKLSDDELNKYISLYFNAESSNTNYFTIELTHCIAITSGAHIIFITPETIGAEKYNKSDLTLEITREKYEGNDFLLIFLEVIPELSPVGVTKNEGFSRKPYLNTKVQLKLVAIKNRGEIMTKKYPNSRNQLFLALYDIKKGEKDSDYIPPCTSMYSNVQLKKKYRHFKSLSENLLDYCIEVMRITNEGREKNPYFHHYMNTFLQPIIAALVHVKSKFNVSLSHAPPIQIFELFRHLAIAIRSSYFTVGSKKQRRSLEKYISKFNVLDKDFILITENVINSEYEHNDVTSVFDKIEALLDVYVEFFEKMRDMTTVPELRQPGDDITSSKSSPKPPIEPTLDTQPETIIEEKEEKDDHNTNEDYSDNTPKIKKGW